MRAQILREMVAFNGVGVIVGVSVGRGVAEGSGVGVAVRVGVGVKVAVGVAVGVSDKIYDCTWLNPNHSSKITSAAPMSPPPTFRPVIVLR